MFEINITITALGLEQALNNLAASLQAGRFVHMPQAQQAIPAQQIAPTQPTTPVQQIQQAAPAQQVNPAPQAQQAAPAQPSQQIATPQAPGVTLDAIINAGAGLVEKGMMAQVVALLKNYGVQAVNQLQPTQYDAFANDLRTLGAQV